MLQFNQDEFSIFSNNMKNLCRSNIQYQLKNVFNNRINFRVSFEITMEKYFVNNNVARKQLRYVLYPQQNCQQNAAEHSIASYS